MNRRSAPTLAQFKHRMHQLAWQVLSTIETEEHEDAAAHINIHLILTFFLQNLLKQPKMGKKTKHLTSP